MTATLTSSTRLGWDISHLRWLYLSLREPSCRTLSWLISGKTHISCSRPKLTGRRIYRDLADSEHDGQLTRDDFAVAMHLIRQRLANKDAPTTPAPTTPSTPSHRYSNPERLPQRHSTDPSPSGQGTPGQRPSSEPFAQATPSLPASPQPEPAADPAAIRLPDDVDDDIRSDTPPPPYELIASDAT